MPAAIAQVQGQKYQSNATEWDAGTQNTGWACLKFSMAEAQYYMYGYTAALLNPAEGSTFTATAQGDLNGNGVASTFTLQGIVRSSNVVISPTIAETLPEE